MDTLQAVIVKFDRLLLNLPPYLHHTSSSSTHGEHLVPRARTALRQHRAFSVAGPMVWNGLPLALRLMPRVHSDAFSCSLKTILFSRSWVGALLSSNLERALYKSSE